MKKSLLDCKVLLVEDVYESRLLVRQLMGRLGVTLIEATDGHEGVRLAKQELPDLVLIDPATAHIPVVIVTAHSMWDEAMRVKEVGCAGYVMKPLDPVRFGEDVVEFLRYGAARTWVPGI